MNKRDRWLLLISTCATFAICTFMGRYIFIQPQPWMWAAEKIGLPGAGAQFVMGFLVLYQISRKEKYYKQREEDNK